MFFYHVGRLVGFTLHLTQFYAPEERCASRLLVRIPFCSVLFRVEFLEVLWGCEETGSGSRGGNPVLIAW